MKSCSTNALYYAAYKILGDMADILDDPAALVHREKAVRLKTVFLAHFWNGETGNLFYLIDEFGKCEHQEGLGAAFAILFELLPAAQVRQLFAGQHVTPHGIPCVWPTFDRYRTPDGLGFGRHSGTVWPHVQGFWAEALARHQYGQLFLHEIMGLADKAARDAQFTEIYHPIHGEIYGGRQEGVSGGKIQLWESCRRQTWSATAYLRMVLSGLLGLRFHADGLSFQPLLTAPVENVQIVGLKYREVDLSLQIRGSGNRIKRALKNGSERDFIFIGAMEKGPIEIVLELESAAA